MTAGKSPEGTPSSPELPQDQKQRLAGALRYFRKHIHDIAAHNMRMGRMGNIEFTPSVYDVLRRAEIPKENVILAINLIRSSGVHVYDDNHITFTKYFISADPFHENFRQDKREDTPDEEVLKDALDGNLKGRKIA